MSSMTAEQRDRLTARRFDAAEPSARPKRSKRGALIGLAVVAGGLFLTNPDSEKFTAVASGIGVDGMMKRKPKDDTDYAYRQMAIAAFPSIVRASFHRDNYFLCSIYTGHGELKGMTMLGVGGSFIRLTNGKG